MNNNESSSTGVLIGILIVVVIAVVGWLAYSQGVFKSKEDTTDNSTLQINVGASPAASAPASI